MFKSRERAKRFELTDEHRRVVAQAKLRKLPGKKFNNRRKVMLAITVAFLLGISQIFVTRHLSPATDTTPDIHQSAMFYAETFPAFGKEAVLFQQLSEAPNAKLTTLEGLSEGSKEAQQRQKSYCEKFKIPLEVRNSIGMEFRLIPPGQFTMGSPKNEDGRGSQLPDEDYHVEEQHKENIFYPIYISKFEVTQEQYRRITNESPSAYPGDNKPVEEVTQIEARAFCNKLSKLEGLPRGTYRLLTEEEWEYCCRAGTKTAFYFKDVAKAYDFMWYGEGNGGQTEEIGARRGNAWGLFNMHGNVNEWCKGFYKSYYGERLHKAERNLRVFRGGSWYHQLPECRSANRARLGDRSHGNMLGFRVARSISKEWKKVQRTRQFRSTLSQEHPENSDNMDKNTHSTEEDTTEDE